jgi:hypothetical protein
MCVCGCATHYEARSPLHGLVGAVLLRPEPIEHALGLLRIASHCTRRVRERPHTQHRTRHKSTLFLGLFFFFLFFFSSLSSLFARSLTLCFRCRLSQTNRAGRDDVCAEARVEEEAALRSARLQPRHVLCVPRAASHIPTDFFFFFFFLIITFFSYFFYIVPLDSPDITDQIIAMGYPSEKVEALYRNPYKGLTPPKRTIRYFVVGFFLFPLSSHQTRTFQRSTRSSKSSTKTSTKSTICAPSASTRPTSSTTASSAFRSTTTTRRRLS